MNDANVKLGIRAAILFEPNPVWGKNACFNGRACQCGNPHWSKPDPLRIDWPTAKRLIRETDPNLFMSELKVIWRQVDDGCSLGAWVALYATSRHHIIAACLAKEKGSS